MSLWSYFEYYLGSPLHLFNKIVENTKVAYPVKYDLFGARTFSMFWIDLHEKGWIQTKVASEDGMFIQLGGSFVGGVMSIQCFPHHLMILEH